MRWISSYRLGKMMRAGKDIYEGENIREGLLGSSFTSKQKRMMRIWCGITLRGPDWVQMDINCAEGGHRGETKSATFLLQCAASNHRKKLNNSHKSSDLMKAELFIYSFIASVYWIGGARLQYHLHPYSCWPVRPQLLLSSWYWSDHRVWKQRKWLI